MYDMMLTYEAALLCQITCISNSVLLVLICKDSPMLQADVVPNTATRVCFSIWISQWSNHWPPLHEKYVIYYQDMSPSEYHLPLLSSVLFIHYTVFWTSKALKQWLWNWHVAMPQPEYLGLYSIKEQGEAVTYCIATEVCRSSPGLTPACNR